MKIYNPLNGDSIKNLSWSTGEFRLVENDEVAEKLLREYPFLINFDLPEYQPSYYERIKLKGFARLRKKIIKLFKR